MIDDNKVEESISFGVNWKTSTIKEVQNVDVSARCAKGWTPLHYAAIYNKNPEVIAVLVKNGADIDALDMSGFAASHYAAVEVLASLTKTGADINVKPSIEVLAVLIENGADINDKTVCCGTSLHHAARFNANLEVFTLLIEHGFDINAKDANDRTPLHLAVSSNKNPEILAFFSRKGCRY